MRKIICLIVIVAAILAWISYIPENISEGSVRSGILPTVKGVANKNITQANINQNICNKNWSTSSIRPSTSYTNPIKVEKLAEYNKQFHTNYQLSEGELDHDISIELGGDPKDKDNLWFEPYTTIPNAHDKDKVENMLHKEVCDGTLTLSQAQHIISTNWTQYLKTPVFGGTEEVQDNNDI